MLKNNPYQAYRQQSVMTMTTADMLTALYDGLLKELNLAKVAFDKKNMNEINRSLQKAQKILNHLKSSLDHKYPIAENLAALYDYFIRVAVRANLRKDPEGIDDIIGMITELRNTYVEADKKMRTAKA